MRILLVEDDEILTDLLTQSLTAQRYAVDTVNDGKFGLEYAQSSDYDLIIVDVGLPRMDGITLCERLRGEGFVTPILLITAKDANSDRIRGLDAGADDYLTKPLNLEELHARVRALLRRGEVSPTTILEIGALTLNPVSCEVIYAEKLLTLTPKEYSLLELLMRNPSRVFSRGAIIEHLWSFDDPPLEDSVKAHIKGLRRKLKQAGATDWVENVYGLGYRLAPKVDDVSRHQATQADLHAVNQPAVDTDEVSESLNGDQHRHPQFDQSSRQSSTSASPSASSTSSTEQKFNQAMDVLWQQYAGLMQERMEVLQVTATAIATHTLTVDLRQKGAHAAHKLAGVLGMFGRDDGTLLARELETVLEQDTSDQLENVPILIERLVELINVERSPIKEVVEDAQILWVADDESRVTEMKQLASDTGLTCQQVNLSQALHTIDTHSPDLVVLNLATATSKEQGIHLLFSLTQHTPTIPAIALLSESDLDNRVAIALTGICQVLPQTAALDQVWDAVTQILQLSRSTSTTILAVDDDPIILNALRRLLSPWNMRVFMLDEPKRFWTILNVVSPDVLILDVEMPDFNGIELCQAVRTDAHWQSLPVLFLTAHRDAETVQRVFEAGGDDYVTKPIVGPELLTRIMNRIERNRILQQLSQKDALTGLPNQRQSRQDIDGALQKAAQQHTSLSIVLLALAELRALYVRHGHGTGHQVLHRIGQILQTTLSAETLIGYWEYGEFVIGLPNVKQSEAYDYLADVLKTLRRQIFTTEQGDRFQVEFSMAIAEFPEAGATMQELYQSVHQQLENCSIPLR